MALDSLIFQFAVRPQIKKGNLIPLAGWLAGNIPLLMAYFYRTTFSTEAKLVNALDNVQPDDLSNFLERLQAMPSTSEAEKNALINVTLSMKEITETERGDRQNLRNVVQQMEDLKRQLANNPEFVQEITTVLESMNSKDLVALLRIVDVKVPRSKNLPKRRQLKAFVNLIAGIAVMGVISPVLDHGLTQLSQALPYLSKASAGFFIMSFVASLGDFLRL